MFLSEWRKFPSAPCLAGEKKKLDDSSRPDVVEIARVPDMLPSLFPSCSGKGLISTPGMQEEFGNLRTDCTVFCFFHCQTPGIINLLAPELFF